MIKINTISATKSIILNADSQEISSLRKQLTYTDTGIQFNIQKLKQNKWLQRERPHTYQTRLKELEATKTTCMIRLDEKTGSYYFPPGVIPYLKGLEFEDSGGVIYPESRKMPWKKPLPFDLYPYQAESVKKLIEAKHACVELCTGAGKTAIILMLARELGLKTVIVTPSTSIFLEIYKKCKYHFGTSKVGSLGGGVAKKTGRQITVCVSRSLTLLKQGSKEYNDIASADVVIGDESHTLAADTLEKVFHGVMKNVPYRFFLSGTQVRGDGKDKLLNSIIGKRVYKLTTKEAVEGGYICPVSFTIIKTKTNDISVKTGKAKKYQDALKTKRKHFLYNKNIADIIAKISNLSWKNAQESTLVLVEELEQIKMIIDRLEVPYEYVHSASKKDASKFGLETRKVDDAVEVFNRGEAKVLIGTSCIATGTNMYPTHNTCNWVGGSSEVKTKQGAVGRSVRLLEKSEYKEFHKEKPYSKIFDFDVENCNLMTNHLDKRIKMYKETNENIKKVSL